MVARVSNWILPALSLFLVAGCVATRPTMEAARTSFASGDLATARQSFEQIADSRSRDAIPAEMDLAIVELAGGDAPAAERRLRRLRDQFDAQPDIDLGGDALSLLADDNARQFRPSGYEEVMIRTLLSLCSLAGDQIDAESYALQAIRKQTELARQAEDRGLANAGEIYQPIAVAPYLRGVLREATHRHYDDALRSYQLVSSVQPSFAPAVADIARASGGTHSPPGHGVLYVIACVGRGPVLQETEAPTTSTALSIASAVLNAETNETGEGDQKRVGGPILPNLASVKVPQVILPPSRIAAVGVNIEGKLRGATQTLTDVGILAERQNEAEMPWTIARAVVRRAMKETAVAKAGDAMNLDGPAGSLFHFATATLWSSTENADTRCWGLLPREIQVFRMELPAGEHRVELQAFDAFGNLLPGRAHQSVTISDGRNHYLMTVANDTHLFVP